MFLCYNGIKKCANCSFVLGLVDCASIILGIGIIKRLIKSPLTVVRRWRPIENTVKSLVCIYMCINIYKRAYIQAALITSPRGHERNGGKKPG